MCCDRLYRKVIINIAFVGEPNESTLQANNNLTVDNAGRNNNHNKSWKITQINQTIMNTETLNS